MFKAVCEAVVANTVFVLLCVFFGIAASWCLRRRSLFKFFGVTGDRRLRIYISQISIAARDDPTVSHGVRPKYRGSVVGFLESTEARKIEELFLVLIPGLAGLPTFLNRIFVADVRVDIDPAGFEPAEPLLDRSYISPRANMKL